MGSRVEPLGVTGPHYLVNLCWPPLVEAARVYPLRGDLLTSP